METKLQVLLEIIELAQKDGRIPDHEPTFPEYKDALMPLVSGAVAFGQWSALVELSTIAEEMDEENDQP